MEYYLKNIVEKEDNQCSVKNIDFLINNQYISYSKVIANAFNMYFINVGSSLANNIHSTSNPLLYVQSTEKCMTIPEVHVNEVNTIISAMKNSASGHDELPTSIQKQCIDSYITPLTCLINISISQGIFPNQLKLVRVISLFKEEDEQLVQNYRPISVLPFFSQKYLKKLWPLMLLTSLKIIICSININLDFRKKTLYKSCHYYSSGMSIESSGHG